MPLVGRSRPSVTDLAPPLEQPRAGRYGGLALEFAGVCRAIPHESQRACTL